MLENESLESKRLINSIIEFEGQEAIRRAIDFKNFQAQSKEGKEVRQPYKRAPPKEKDEEFDSDD